MTYSTELPEGFKTWNELWQSLKHNTITDGIVGYYVNDGQYLYSRYEEHFIKSKCYDEIMELMGRAYDWEIPTEDQESDFVSDLEQLTHTKLFK